MNRNHKYYLLNKNKSMSQIVNSLYFKSEFKKNNEKHLLRTESERGPALVEESDGEGDEEGGEEGSEVGGAVTEVCLAGILPVLGAAL